MISQMIKRAVAVAVGLTALSGITAHAQALNGAGSTFVDPIMTQWIAGYKKATGVSINYQPIGSGGGIAALIGHTVDFAGSDVPMNAQEQAEAKAPVIHLPDVAGAVTVAYNIPGIGPGIHLTGPVLADIYLGKILYWNDPRIMSLSPGTKFPHARIFVAHRSDGSGTTAIFTNYLSKISPTWKSSVGEGKSVHWPEGLGGKGNAGVAGLLSTHKYSLGYIELAYAVQNAIPYAFMQNSKGKFVYPSVASAAAAASGVTPPANLEFMVTNSPKPDAYPITGYSWLIVYKNAGSKAADIKRFLHWVVTSGQSYNAKLLYANLPASMVAKEQKLIDTIR